MNREEFKKIIEKFNANYRNNKLDNEEQKYWYKMLKDYSYGDVNYRFDKHLASSEKHQIKIKSLYQGLIKEKYKVDNPIQCNECNTLFKYPDQVELYEQHIQTHLRKNNLIRYLKKINLTTSEDINTMNDDKFNNQYRKMLQKVLSLNNGQLNTIEVAMITAIIKDDLKYYQNEVSKHMKRG